MISLRRSDERGHTDLGWLDSRHTFSFGDYMNPAHMGFRTLRVINDDRVQPGRGFGTHGHRDMEIVSYVLEGELEHKDSMGTGSVIRPGEVQRMSAGTGVLHSEFNPSRTQKVRFLQIWILPEREGTTPGYEQRHFPEGERRGKLRLAASRDGRDGSLTLQQDAAIYLALLSPGTQVSHDIAKGRHAWIQVASGEVNLVQHRLGEGDGAAISGEPRVTVTGVTDAEILLFDLS